MPICKNLFVSLVALTLTFSATERTQADEPGEPVPAGALTTQQVWKAAERGLEFLEQDAVAWRKSKSCSTCHHGLMTVWALSEARSQGYAVAPETLAEMTTWARTPLANIGKPRDTRSGWNMLNTQALYLAVMSQVMPRQDVVSPDELKQIADHLIRHQESDGSWAWSLAPPANRFPPFMESDEVVTWLVCLTLGPHVPADQQEQSVARESREKAINWLAKTESTGTTQAAAVQLLARTLAGEKPEALEPEIAALLSRQQKDGGWGQLNDRASDGYATGQVLYALSVAGLKNDRAEVQRGLAFLVATQQENGSWPMVGRAQPGEKPAKSPVPITYFGSTWATLALMRTVPKQPSEN